MSWDRRRRNRNRGGQQQQEGRDFGGADRPGSPSGARQYNIDPFALFCAYHLGITEDDKYKFQNIHQVARRFNTNAAVVKQMLVDYGMDPETVVNCGYDMAAAQVDIMVAPDGISRTELARPLFEEYQAAPKRARDWQKELEADARENERTYGKR